MSQEELIESTQPAGGEGQLRQDPRRLRRVGAPAYIDDAGRTPTDV